MKKALPLIILIAVIIGAAVFWSQRNSTKPSTSSSMSAMNMSNSSGSATHNTTQTTDKVEIKNFAFSPAVITIKKGTTVTWTNQDSAVHTVTESDSQDGPKSGNLSQGASYTFRFDTVGTFHYHCLIHPNMLGTVTVTE